MGEFKVKLWKPSENRKRNGAGTFTTMWSPRREKRVYKLYVLEGKSLRACAAEFNCSHGAVQNLVEARGWIRQKPGITAYTKKFCEENRKKLLTAYKTQSASSLIKKYNLNAKAFITFLKQNGVWRGLEDRHVLYAKERASWDTPFKKFYMAYYLSFDYNKMDHRDYTKLLKVLTTQVYRKYKSVIDPDKKRSQQYPLDHIFSLKAAAFTFKEGKWVLRNKYAKPWLVAHPANLRIISIAHNTSRSSSNHPSTYDEKALMKRIKAFNQKFGDPFENFQKAR